MLIEKRPLIVASTLEPPHLSKPTHSLPKLKTTERELRKLAPVAACASCPSDNLYLVLFRSTSTSFSIGQNNPLTPPQRCIMNSPHNTSKPSKSCFSHFIIYRGHSHVANDLISDLVIPSMATYHSHSYHHHLLDLYLRVGLTTTG